MYLVGKRGRHGENHPTDIFSHPEGFRTPSHPPCREPDVGHGPCALPNGCRHGFFERGLVVAVEEIPWFSMASQGLHAEYAGTSNQSNRYFLASSAIQSKQGQGHYQTNVAMHSVSYSVSDRITAGAMVGFFGVWLTAKARWQVGEKTSVGLGGLGAADFLAALNSMGLRNSGESTLGLGLHQRDPGRRQQEHHLQCGVQFSNCRIWLWLHQREAIISRTLLFSMLRCDFPPR